MCCYLCGTFSQSLENMSGDDLEEDAEDGGGGGERQAEGDEGEVSMTLAQLAPLSTISEVTLNYGSRLSIDDDEP